jgi:cytochrome b6-f complex iron-sulfur subunit
MKALLRTLFGLLLVPVVGRLAALLHRAKNSHQPRATRRTFLRNVVLGSVGVVALEIAGAFGFLMWPLKTGKFGSTVTIAKDQVPATGTDPYVDREGKFYLINNQDGLLALYWKCVHLGCTVPWNAGEQSFHCPCHGSVYDRHGVRIAGPAPRPLDLMEVTVDGSGNVQVNTGKITERTDYKPEQAIPYTA